VARKHEFSVDMHVHSMYSGESLAQPREIVESALDKGLDAICVTEHESLSASAPFERFKGTSRLIILRGVELSTDAGHMLVYGIEDSAWREWGKNEVCHAPELVTRVRALGGVVVPAHPYLICGTCGDSPYPRDLPIEVDERAVHLAGISALEVCNGKHQRYPMVCEILGNLAKRLGLPGTGGSDAHLPEDVGCAYTVFRAPVSSSQDLVKAILTGDLYPRNGTQSCRRPATLHVSAH